MTHIQHISYTAHNKHSPGHYPMLLFTQRASSSQMPCWYLKVVCSTTSTISLAAGSLIAGTLLQMRHVRPDICHLKHLLCSCPVELTSSLVLNLSAVPSLTKVSVCIGCNVCVWLIDGRHTRIYQQLSVLSKPILYSDYKVRHIAAVMEKWGIESLLYLLLYTDNYCQLLHYYLSFEMYIFCTWILYLATFCEIRTSLKCNCKLLVVKLMETFSSSV